MVPYLPMGLLIALLDTIGPILGDLAGVAFATFVGAWAAFLLQARHDRQRQGQRDISAGRRAQFALVAQESVLRNVQILHLQPLKNTPHRYLLLKPMSSFQRIPDLDLGSLEFMLDSKDADLLNQLLDCNNKYTTVLGNLQLRAAAHMEFQQRLAAAEKQGFHPVAPVHAIEAAVGGDIVGSLRSLTDMLYESVEVAVTANEACFQALSDYLRRTFPGQKVLKRSIVPGFELPGEGNAA